MVEIKKRSNKDLLGVTHRYDNLYFFRFFGQFIGPPMTHEAQNPSEQGHGGDNIYHKIKKLAILYIDYNCSNVWRR